MLSIILSSIGMVYGLMLMLGSVRRCFAGAKVDASVWVVALLLIYLSGVVINNNWEL